MTKTELVILLWFGFAWTLCSIIRWMWRKLQVNLKEQVESIIEEINKGDETNIQDD